MRVLGAYFLGVFFEVKVHHNVKPGSVAVVGPSFEEKPTGCVFVCDMMPGTPYTIQVFTFRIAPGDCVYR